MHTFIHTNTNTNTNTNENMREPAKNEHAHAHKEEEEAELFVAAVHRVRNCLEIVNCILYTWAIART